MTDFMIKDILKFREDLVLIDFIEFEVDKNICNGFIVYDKRITSWWKKFTGHNWLFQIHQNRKTGKWGICPFYVDDFKSIEDLKQVVDIIYKNREEAND